MIGSFFTCVAPSHGNETGQVVPPDENAGKQLVPHQTDHLELLLPVDLADRGEDQVILVLENAVAKGQRKLVLDLIDRILRGIDLSSMAARILESRSLYKAKQENMQTVTTKLAKTWWDEPGRFRSTFVQPDSVMSQNTGIPEAQRLAATSRGLLKVTARALDSCSDAIIRNQWVLDRCGTCC